MIDNNWKRIAGIHVQQGGSIFAIWLALEPDTDLIQVYDACEFKVEVPVVIAEGLNARGRWIPIGWEKSAKTVADQLLDRGCNMTYEPNDDSDWNAETVSRDIWERIRTKRFQADKRLKAWADEYKSFNRDQQKIPKDTFPYMSATRHAMALLSYAKRLNVSKSQKINYPKTAII